MSLETLLARIRERLSKDQYRNEAAISTGVVLPVLRALGWDDSDPDQVAPEFTSGRGRVDFALFGAPLRGAVFVEVKGVGRSDLGDRQLFEYAFHEGVPLCILTDGREWSFYLPAGQGNYDERRVHRLRLDERSVEDAARVLNRYLDRERVRSGVAHEDAIRDYRDLASRREASRTIPEAWKQLVAEPEDLLIELVADQTEAMSGFRPLTAEVIAFLRGLGPASALNAADPIKLSTQRLTGASTMQVSPLALVAAQREVKPNSLRTQAERGPVYYQILGEQLSARNAKEAFVDVLGKIAARFPQRIEAIAEAARGRTRNHIAQSVDQIYPDRQDLASLNTAEILDGWLVGLNIANREKVRIVRAACGATGLRFGSDVKFELPNA
ncbi:hypothetical protein EYC08_13850 [Tabrizicola sp. WMC-M-20]|nr:hypothetical protein EYC08_13850 [Tabrizicola sp. WMC-M-20]